MVNNELILLIDGPGRNFPTCLGHQQSIWKDTSQVNLSQTHTLERSSSFWGSHNHFEIPFQCYLDASHVWNSITHITDCVMSDCSKYEADNSLDLFVTVPSEKNICIGLVMAGATRLALPALRYYTQNMWTRLSQTVPAPRIACHYVGLHKVSMVAIIIAEFEATF